MLDYMTLYDILASNCGSCPNTTNHTSVTCTDIPTNGSTCTLAIQTVVCIEDTDCITGNTSDSISVKVLNTRPSHDHDTMEHVLNDSMLIASVIFLVASLATCIAVSVTVIAYLLISNRARIKSIFDGFWQLNRSSSTTADKEATYDDVTGSSPSVRLSVISTKHNVAYGQKLTVTASTAATQNEPNEPMSQV